MMALTPEVSGIPLADVAFDNVRQPSLTYKLDFDRKRIAGAVDGKEAVKQAIMCILLTERYEYLIYSWNYGIELNSLIGRSGLTINSELRRIITEALMADDRILSVEDFSFDWIDRKTVNASFTVRTIYGDDTITSELRLNV